MTKKDCLGCEDDFYNGKNPLGVKECWAFDKSKQLEPRLRIPVDLRPPYKHIKPVRVPPCYKEKRICMVKPEAIASDGYWKR